MTDGNRRVENRLAITLRKGNEPRASSVSTGSMTTRMTVTADTVMRLAIVSGIITTSAWICWRSVLPRLIS